MDNNMSDHDEVTPTWKTIYQESLIILVVFGIGMFVAFVR
jgi:hypothetical protein